ERRGNLCVDSLVWAHIGTERATEIKEGLPPDKAPRCSAKTAQVNGVSLPISRRIENHAEKRLAVVTVEIGTVRWPYHAVSKAVGDLELYRNKRVAGKWFLKSPT